MKVTADILVAYNDRVDTIFPAVTMLTADDGTTSLMDLPAELPDERAYLVSIRRILADQAAIIIDVPGLTDQNMDETLLLDISKKPVINLVWIGTTILLVGSVLVVLRRRRDLIGINK